MKNFTRILLAAGLAVIGNRVSAQTLYDNFENTRLVSYPTVNGGLTQNAPNPGTNAVNGSTTCAAYVRSTTQYDVIVIKPTAAPSKMADVSAYSAGTKKISVKFRSAAAGVTVQAVLQNSTKSNTQQYPSGKYAGDFTAVTTMANAWETLTFTFATGTAGNFDPGTTATDVDQLVLLIAPGTMTSATYYFDDLMGPELLAATTPTPAPTVVTDQLYDNHEGTRVIKYKRNLTAGAFKVDTANPSKTTGNMSNNVFRYSRSVQQYDGIFIAPVGAPVADVTPFVNKAKQMTLRVYSPAVGTRFQITMQDSVAARRDYPAGRHSEYLATTTTANAWENLVFSFSARPDAGVANTGVNEFVILINSNTLVGLKVYLDDFNGPHLTNYVPTATRSSATSTAAFAAPYPNPSTSLVHLPYSLEKAGTVSLALFDVMGRRVATALDNQARPAGDYSADLSTANLAPGLYTCRLVIDGVALTRALSVK